jgi:cytochrome P450
VTQPPATQPLVSRPANRYDPADPEFQTHIYEIYDRLRADQPLYHNPDKGFWAVSRYRDVETVLTDWANFSSRTPAVPQPDGHLAVQDPPRHTELRRLVALAFTPRRLSELGPLIRGFADDLLADVAGAPGFDLVQQFSDQLPGRVFGHMIGIPPDEQAGFEALLGEYVAGLNAASYGVAIDDGPRVRTESAIRALVEQRRADPQRDLLTDLVTAEIDGERLTDQEVLGFCFNLILAANETTSNLLANGVATLYRHPDQLTLLTARPELLAGAIEEMLRYESPVQALHRTVVRETPVAGGVVPAGASLQVLYGAANRDPAAFEDPDRFDITRSGRRHLAFGRGIHFCIGAHLARLEAVEGFHALLPILADYRLEDTELDWRISPWQRSLTRLSLSRRS